MERNRIPFFENINDLHTATGYDHRTHIPTFDIFTLESLEPTCARCMPPYKQGFYQVGILSHSKGSKINLNTNSVELSGMPLWFVVPGQVFSWVRSSDAAGYHIQFKKDFLSNIVTNFVDEFPFLRLTENRVLTTTHEEEKSLMIDMERMLSVYQNPHPYQKEMLQGMLLSVLYNCKSVYEQYKSSQSTLSRGQILTEQFQQLVDNRYIDTKNVQDYASALSVTPNYLTTTVKEVMGKSAKDVIQERLFLESKNLLAFSKLDIAEVAYRLNFQEPTHFTRFFKKYSGTTPNEFRKVQ